MQKLEQIVGYKSDPEIADRLHGLEHKGQVEYLALKPEDLQRHRLRVTGDQETEFAISIPRDQRLVDGAVLMLDRDRAVIVKAEEQRWLRVKPHNSSAALALGYFAGNMHWKVRFDGPILEIAIQGVEADYLARLSELMADGQVELAL
ncbi:MAG: urease accessory protein UreE [Methyloligella sp. ZOD6]